MASTGAKFPTSGTTADRASATAWTNPGFITADDTSYATAAVPTDYLIATGYDFSSIPNGSVIQGVTVVVNASESGSGLSDYVPQLCSAATPTLIGSAKTAISLNGTTQTSNTSGSSSDVWGASLTAAIVKNSGFGAVIWSTDTTNTLSVDYITIDITYEAPFVITPGSGTLRTVGQLQVTVAVTVDTTTVSPTVGTVLLVGQQPAVSTPVLVAPSVGTILLVGQIPTVSTPVSVAPSVGTVLLVGKQPTVASQGWTVVVGTASAPTLATPDIVAALDWGRAPTVWTLRTVGQLQVTVTVTGGGADVTANPLVGTVLLVGNQPTVQTPVLTAPTVGTVLLVGQQPTVATPVVTAPTVGTVLLAGQQPTVQTPVLTAPAVGTVLLVGQQPTVGIGSNVSPGVGTVLLVGNQPTVQTPVVTSPAVGTVLLVGQQPVVGIGANTQPSTGTVLLVGQQPTVQTPVSVAPSVGTVLLVGKQPTVETPVLTAPAVGTVLLVGQQPNIAVTEHQAVAPSVGAVLLVGQQPTVQTPVVVAPTVGTVLTAGQQPTVGVGINAQPGSGTILLVGQQPTVSLAGDVIVVPGVGTVRFVGGLPTIVVSGAVSEERNAGGWPLALMAREQAARKRRLEEELEEDREREELADRLESVLVEDGSLTQARADLIRLRGLVAQYRSDDLPNKARRAVAFAERAQSEFSLRLAMRELRKVQEEEELAVLLVMALD